MKWDYIQAIKSFEWHNLHFLDLNSFYHHNWERNKDCDHSSCLVDINVRCSLLFFLLFLRILCETVKDFVAKVGKAYEKSTENAEECDTMSLKVRLSYNIISFPERRHLCPGPSLIVASFSLCLFPSVSISVPFWMKSWTHFCRPSTQSARHCLHSLIPLLLS